MRLYAIAGLVLLLLLAGLLLAAEHKVRASARKAERWEDVPQKDLFFEVDPDTKTSLLEDWRWKVGSDATVLRVTVFGDLFIQSSGGRIYWLDTGMGDYLEVASNAEQWAQAMRSQGQRWLHWETLQKLRALGVGLKKGQVYSWRRDPMLGGAESADNVDFIPLTVHVSHAGRVAEAIKDIPPGTKINYDDLAVMGRNGEDTTLYEVVINEELQYSMLPVGRAIPAGWKTVGKSGTKQACLAYIKSVWTDMRPLSLRKKLDGH